MEPSDIGKAYDTISHLWMSEKFNRENGIVPHKKAIAFVANRGVALDVGCGCTGRFIDLLLENGFEPEGVDISIEMIGLAQQRHPQITFFHQDICKWSPPRKYDLITAWDSIWHVPLNEQEHVLTKLIASLNDNGVLIFSFGGTSKASENIDDFMGPKVYYSSLGTNGFIELCINLGCGIRHVEYDQYPELHAYMIVQKI